MLTLVQAIQLTLEGWRDFEGRSRRSEFWWVQLAVTLGAIVMVFVDGALGYDIETADFTPALMLFDLVTIMPVAAVTARRLHDVGLTGWAQLPLYLPYISYIPEYQHFLTRFESPAEMALGVVFAIYGIWLLINLIRDSDAGANKYGRNPKSGDLSGHFD